MNEREASANVQVDKERLEDRDDHKDKDKDNNIREVSDIGGAVPFVEFSRYHAREEDTHGQRRNYWLKLLQGSRGKKEVRWWQEPTVHSGQRRSSWQS